MSFFSLTGGWTGDSSSFLVSIARPNHRWEKKLKTWKLPARVPRG